MGTVTVKVAGLDEAKRRLRNAFKGKSQGAQISFVTPELLFAVMTRKRWDLLKAIVGAGPLTIREVARRANRDVKAVHGDVHALLTAGILRKTENRRIEFPFDALKLEAELKPQAAA